MDRIEFSAARLRKPAAGRAAGFSLVEVLVAVVLGLVVVGGVVTVLVTSKTTYTTQDSLARLQENARFALEFIARDLRMASYFGCADNLAAVTTSLNNVAGAIWELKRDAAGRIITIDAFEHQAADGKWQPSGVTTKPGNMAANTDAITIRYLDGGGAQPLQADMVDATSPVVVATGKFVVGDVLAVSNCMTTDVFMVTGSTSAQEKDSLAHAAGTGGLSNATASLGTDDATKKTGKRYQVADQSTVTRLRGFRYFIGTADKTCPGGADTGLPARRGLYRQGLTDCMEIVSGIENMQILYGVKTDGDDDRAPNVYLRADAVGAGNWANVVSIRVGLLAYTLADTGYQQGGQIESAADMIGSGTIAGENQYQVNGTLLTLADQTLENRRVQRHVFHETVYLRNNR